MAQVMFWNKRGDFSPSYLAEEASAGRIIMINCLCGMPAIRTKAVNVNYH